MTKGGGRADEGATIQWGWSDSNGANPFKKYSIKQYGILKLNSSVLPSIEGYISQYTPQGVYGLIVNEINKRILTIMIVKIIYCPYLDSTRVIRLYGIFSL